MKIALLSRQPKGYSTVRFKEEAEKRGHKMIRLNVLNFSIQVESSSPELYYNGKPLSTYDAVLPRIGASVTFYGLAVLRQFEQMGVYAANESLAISRSRDKLRSAQVMSRYEIGLPASAFVRNKKDVLPAIERVGGAPVIIKLLEGTQGVGVILAESERVASAIIETLQSTKQNVLIQKFVKESKGKDLRAIVVGDRVIAAMRRRARGEEFRSNVHRGGTTEVVEIDKETERTAIRAAQIMGLRIAGVDMLEASDGPQVMEVNSSPGLEGIETVSGVNVAGAILEDIEHQIKFPDLDIHNKLRLTGGYSIAEVYIHDNPHLAEKTLAEAKLTEKNIYVLNINRDNEVIPNPKGDEVIQNGDTLLCYGEMFQLRELIPERIKGKKKKSK